MLFEGGKGTGTDGGDGDAVLRREKNMELLNQKQGLYGFLEIVVLDYLREWCALKPVHVKQPSVTCRGTYR